MSPKLGKNAEKRGDRSFTLHPTMGVIRGGVHKCCISVRFTGNPVVQGDLGSGGLLT
jgi:hypothetical protein